MTHYYYEGTRPKFTSSVPCAQVVAGWLQCSMTTSHLKSYFQSTSLHGLQYVGEEGRPVLEKLLWLVLFCLGIALMIIFFIPGNTNMNKNILISKNFQTSSLVDLIEWFYPTAFLT